MADALADFLFVGRKGAAHTLREVVAAMRDALAHAAAVLRRADIAVTPLVSPRLMAEFDQAYADLRVAIVATGAVIYGTYGEAACADVELASALPSDPTRLVQLADSAATLLRHVDLGAPRAGVVVQPAELAVGLERAAYRLKRVLAELPEPDPATWTARQNAVVTWDAQYAGFTEALAGIALSLGRPHLAARIRPSVERRNGRGEAGGSITVEDPSFG